MTNLRFHGNRKPEGVFSITADGVLFFNGEQVGRIEAQREYVPHANDTFGHRSIEFVAMGLTLKTGAAWNAPTLLSTSIASTRGEDVIVPDPTGRTLSDSAVAQVIAQYDRIVRQNNETTSTHSVFGEVTDPVHLYEVKCEVIDTATDCGYGDLTDADVEALHNAAERYVNALREEVAK